MKYLFQLDTLIACLLIFGVTWALFYIPMNFDFLSPLKQAIGDFDITDMAQTKISDDYRNNVDTNIVLVNISSLDRKGIATLIERIRKEEPKVIGIDAMFRNPKGDSLDIPLTQAITNAGNIVLGNEIVYDDKKEVFTDIIGSNPMFNEKAASLGFVNVVTGDEKSFRTVREFSPQEKVGDSTVLNFGVQIAKAYNPNAVTKLLARDNTTEVIGFRGNYSSFYAFDTEQILDDSADLSIIKNKIVLIGYLGERMDTTVHALDDVFFTPMNQRYAGKTFPDMYGVVIHANIISQILHGEYIDVMPDYATYILSLLLCLLNIAVFNAFEERDSKWYDTFTIVSILVQSIICTYSIVYVFHTFLYKMNMTLTLATLALTPTVHEMYNNSIKPLVIEAWTRLRRRFGKKPTLPPAPPPQVAVFIALSIMALLSVIAIQAQDMKVLSVRGKVSIVKGKATSPLRTGMKLSGGDKISVADKSSVSLLHSRGRSVDVNKPGSYAVSDIMAQAAKASSFSSKFASYVYNELTETSDAPSTDNHKKNMKTTGSVERVGGDRQRNVDALTEILQDVGAAEEGQSLNADAANIVESVLQDDNLSVVMPRSSYLLEPTVTFSWFKNSGVQSYIIVLLDATGVPALRKTVSDTVCRIDMVAEKLERGKNYYWKVMRADKESVRSTEYCLQLLPESQAQAIRDTMNSIDDDLGKSPFSNIIKAQYAEDSGLHVDAIKNYNDAVATSANEDYKRYYRNYLRRLNLFEAAQKVH